MVFRRCRSDWGTDYSEASGRRFFCVLVACRYRHPRICGQGLGKPRGTRIAEHLGPGLVRVSDSRCRRCPLFSVGRQAFYLADYGQHPEPDRCCGVWRVRYAALMKAMRSGSISTVTPFRYTRLLFGISLGMVVFDEQFDLPMIVGCLVVIGSGLFICWQGRVSIRVTTARL